MVKNYVQLMPYIIVCYLLEEVVVEVMAESPKFVVICRHCVTSAHNITSIITHYMVSPRIRVAVRNMRTREGNKQSQEEKGDYLDGCSQAKLITALSLLLLSLVSHTTAGMMTSVGGAIG